MICCKLCDYYYNGRCDYCLNHITNVSPYREACPVYENRVQADLREKFGFDTSDIIADNAKKIFKDNNED